MEHVSKAKFSRKEITVLLLLISIMLVTLQILVYENFSMLEKKDTAYVKEVKNARIPIAKESIEEISKIEITNDIHEDEILSSLKSEPVVNKAQLKAEKIVQATGINENAAKVIIDYSEKFNVPTSIILAVIDVESNFNQFEVGNSLDRGYGQIIPGTEEWLVDTYGDLLDIKYDPERIFEPEYNIGLCVLYLNHLQKNYKENYHRILSEYNRGPYNLAKYYEKNNTYATSYSKTVLSREKKYKNF